GAAHEVRGRWPAARRLLAGVAVLAAAAAAMLLLVLPQKAHNQAFMLRTEAGRLVGEAVMSRSDPRNASLSLTARGMPVDRGHMFGVLASDDRHSMEGGRFMVDRTGGCRVRFNLPASHGWSRLWVTEAEKPATVVAAT